MGWKSDFSTSVPTPLSSSSEEDVLIWSLLDSVDGCIWMPFKQRQIRAISFISWSNKVGELSERLRSHSASIILRYLPRVFWGEIPEGLSTQAWPGQPHHSAYSTVSSSECCPCHGSSISACIFAASSWPSVTSPEEVSHFPGTTGYRVSSPNLYDEVMLLCISACDLINEQADIDVMNQDEVTLVGWVPHELFLFLSKGKFGFWERSKEKRMWRQTGYKYGYRVAKRHLEQVLFLAVLKRDCLLPTLSISWICIFSLNTDNKFVSFDKRLHFHFLIMICGVLLGKTYSRNGLVFSTFSSKWRPWISVDRKHCS